MIEEWVEQCRNGHTRAFANIVQAMQQRILVFLYRMTQNRETAEDLGQEVFLRAYNQLAKYDRSKAAFSTWLFTIARNLCLDELRRKKPVRVCIEEAAFVETDPTVNPQRLARENELEQKITQAIDSLEAPFREVFILHEYQYLPLDEVAEITGLPVGTVKSRLHRARLQLQAKLAPVLCS